LLLERGYEVFGTIRRLPGEYPNLDELWDRIGLVDASILDRASLERAFRKLEPAEVYNLAAPSFVPSSWEDPIGTTELAAVGVTTLLEVIRTVSPSSRFYQASSSEIFGEPETAPQNEETRVAPVTPYGVAKAYGHLLTRSYRRRYGLHLSCGILYNHESPRRAPDYLPRKVSSAVARIRAGLQDELVLGDLEARRDWGDAGDAVRAMWLMLQQDEPDDYVVATGSAHSVGELVELAFAHAGLDWRRHVKASPALVRGLAEPRGLVGDASRARQRLAWEPTVDFQGLVGRLVDADIALLDAELRNVAPA
jgi:GDPmannose 4,6-dehydratase